MQACIALEYPCVVHRQAVHQKVPYTPLLFKMNDDSEEGYFHHSVHHFVKVRQYSRSLDLLCLHLSAVLPYQT